MNIYNIFFDFYNSIIEQRKVSDKKQSSVSFFKIISNRNSITCLEDLSNELLLELFEYFNGCKLWKAFWNLNTRFQNLLTCALFPLKIDSFYSQEKDILNCCNEFIFPNRQRIISLHLRYWKTTELFFKSMTIDSSFQRLESFRLSLMRQEDLIPLIITLTSLPRLVSLYLFKEDDYQVDDLGEIYQLIFNLPVLKYNTLVSEEWTPWISLPISDNNQYSTIEYMTINHNCCLDQLLMLLSYTPQLRRLIFRGSFNSPNNDNDEISITLPNLRYLRMNKCYLTCDEFQSFIMQINSPLRVMRITTCNDSAYLDANRWERFILHHMPSLQEFYFEHHESFTDCFRVAEYHKSIHRFTSSFWIERKWILQLNTTVIYKVGNEMICSICPHK